jgi:hypothetical protein
MNDKLQQLQILLEQRFLDKEDYRILDNQILSKRAITFETQHLINEIIPIATTCPTWVKSKYFRQGYVLKIILKTN